MGPLNCWNDTSGLHLLPCLHTNLCILALCTLCTYHNVLSLFSNECYLAPCYRKNKVIAKANLLPPLRCRVPSRLLILAHRAAHSGLLRDICMYKACYLNINSVHVVSLCGFWYRIYILKSILSVMLSFYLFLYIAETWTWKRGYPTKQNLRKTNRRWSLHKRGGRCSEGRTPSIDSMRSGSWNHTDPLLCLRPPLWDWHPLWRLTSHGWGLLFACVQTSQRFHAAALLSPALYMSLLLGARCIDMRTAN